MAQNTDTDYEKAQMGERENPWYFLSDPAPKPTEGLDDFEEINGEGDSKKAAIVERFGGIEKASLALKEMFSDITEDVQSIEYKTGVGKPNEEASSESSKRVHEHFAIFSRDIMGVDFVKAQSMEEHYFTRNMSIARYAAAIIICCDIFWLSINALTYNSLNLDAPSARIGLLVQLVASIYIFLLSFFYKKRQGAILRISFLIFAASVIFGVAGLIDAKNLLYIQQNTITQSGQIAFCSLFLVIVILLPLPSLIDSAIVIIMILCGFALPLASPGAAAYSVQQSAILTVVIIVAYCYFWYDCRKGAQKDANNVQLVERLAEASYIDALTHTFNRQAFDLALKHLCDDETTVSVGFMIFDIDDFKHYNDRCSHSMGDEALRNICGAIEDALDLDGRTHPFLYRYGGEEFVVMFENPTPYRLMTEGVRLKNAVWNANLVRSDESEYPRLTITAGCAIEQIEDLRNPDYDAIHNADIQLYIGKRAKKNCVVIQDDVYR